MTMLDLSGTSAGASKHSRGSAGSPTGGQFVKGGGSGSSSGSAPAKKPAATAKPAAAKKSSGTAAANAAKKKALKARLAQLQSQVDRLNLDIKLLQKQASSAKIQAAEKAAETKKSAASGGTTAAKTSTTATTSAAAKTAAAKKTSTAKASTTATAKAPSATAQNIATLQAQKAKVVAAEKAVMKQIAALSNTQPGLELSAQTAALASTPHPLGKKGLWGVKGMELPPYVQNIAHALLRTGRAKTKGQAIAIARAATKRWKTGRHTSPEVKAASTAADAQWRASQVRAHAEHSNVSAGALQLASPTSTAGRKAAAKKGNALPDGSFPIPNASYLKKAVRAVGRAPASKRPAIKRLIKKRAAQLGAQGAVKGTWVMDNATPAVSSSDGPRVTGMAKTAKMGLAPHQATAYAKMRKKGVPHASAVALAKRTKKPSAMKNLSNVQLATVTGPPLRAAKAKAPGPVTKSGAYKALRKRGIPHARAAAVASRFAMSKPLTAAKVGQTKANAATGEPK